MLSPPVAASPLTCDSADFDGSDSMARANLTGIADSKQGIFSCWIRIDSDAAPFTILTGIGAFQLLLSVDFALDYPNPGDKKFGITLFDDIAAITGLVEAYTASSYAAGATWHHLFFAWDNGAGVAKLFVDGVDDTAILTQDDILVEYSTLDTWVVGDNSSGTLFTNGCLAELYFAPGQYLDPAVLSNMRKFRTSGGKPADLGADGATPTGTAPKIYLHLDDAEAAANFALNAGSGGNFTITGTLGTGSTSPSD